MKIVWLLYNLKNILRNLLKPIFLKNIKVDT